MQIFKPKSKAVDDIKAHAIEAAEAARHANHIRVSSLEGRREVCLTTVIKGQDLAWINYNATQLDELISLLQQKRDGLR